FFPSLLFEPDKHRRLCLDSFFLSHAKDLNYGIFSRYPLLISLSAVSEYKPQSYNNLWLYQKL
ncbi:MAG: hypothetical protein ACNS64_15990, partial [Candidatus Halalkalibacterium sp. M3_1C_030]